MCVGSLRIRAVILHQRYIAHWRKGRNRMLEYHLLAAIAVNDNRVVVKSANNPSDLKTICQINGYWNALLAQLVQKRILDINRLIHRP